jgi:hypothetical protein
MLFLFTQKFKIFKIINLIFINTILNFYKYLKTLKMFLVLKSVINFFILKKKIKTSQLL